MVLVKTVKVGMVGVGFRFLILASIQLVFGQGYTFRVLANKGANKIKKAGSGIVMSPAIEGSSVGAFSSRSTGMMIPSMELLSMQLVD